MLFLSLIPLLSAVIYCFERVEKASNIIKTSISCVFLTFKVLLDGASADYIWFLMKQELEEHLLYRCSLVEKIWYSIFKWIRTKVMLLGNVVSLLNYFSSSSLEKKLRKILTLLTIWKIWEAQNELFCLLRIRRRRRLPIPSKLPLRDGLYW